MSRHLSPPVPRAAGLRWLTVILALAGLGVLHGAHCADEPPITVVAMAATTPDGPRVVADVTDTATATLAVIPAHGGHDDTHPSPGAVAGACLFLMTAVVGTALVLAVALRRGLHASTASGGPSPPDGSRRPARVPLAELGVLRI